MIKLLVVDDSPLMRRLLGELFSAEDDFAVCYARNGVEALAVLGAELPDVITLDIQMPEMDGLACLDRIMVQRPTPVVMASSLTPEGGEAALQALSLGAVDVIGKPSGALSLRMDEFGPALVAKVRAAAAVRLPQTRRLRERMRARAMAEPKARPKGAASPRPPRRKASKGEGLVMVGASTGGPPALDALLSPLPASFPWPILIAQHMPESFTGALARRLDGLTELSVCEVREPTALKAGCVYVARGDADVLLTRRAGALAALSAPSSPAFRWHPSVDRMVVSAREVLPAERLVGVLMTGMGNDGARAMTDLHRDGGVTLAQSESTAVIWGMPGELVRGGGASAVCDVDDLAPALIATLGAA
ncbi:MAG: chemotaxis-specific protein-glutamate methyltransferase CheB [Proteobacteria bacterium]|nr:chemotaxis-specific protein-glutamate methyltransferase CheB [Pseudomonadota bacterium]